VFGSSEVPISVCKSFGGWGDCLDVGVHVRIDRWSERVFQLSTEKLPDDGLLCPEHVGVM
jgi:hypothetical protein